MTATFPNVNLAPAGCPDLESLRYPMFASEKLDGVRAVILDGVALSRNMLPLHENFQRRMSTILRLLPREIVLDCEVFNPTYTFSQITSGIAHADEENVRLYFYVFDAMSRDEWFGKSCTPFDRRRDLVELACDEYDPDKSFLVPVKQIVMPTAKAVQSHLAEAVGVGKEGLMLRSPNQLYKHGRSTLKQGDFVKLKAWETVDCQIIGFKQGKTLTESARALNTDKDAFGRTKRGDCQADRESVDGLGSVEVRCPDGSTCFAMFTAGSEARSQIVWQGKEQWLGKMVEVEYQSVGTKDKLRLPRIIRLRPDLDA